MKIFHTAKENQTFNNFESETDLEELSGINMGHNLHCIKAYTVNLPSMQVCPMQIRLYPRK
jgi:hypothetical protein